MKASNPTTNPTELRARCGCRFEPKLIEGEDEGTLEQTAICVPHSAQRTVRIIEETALEDMAPWGEGHDQYGSL